MLATWGPLALGLGLAAGAAAACPPVGTQKDFDLATFVSKRWYVQQQAATSYLPASQNFCVYADYQVLPKKTFWGYTIQVHNHAEEKDGKVHDSGTSICAKGADAADPAKLEVAPCFLPPASAGPYWVIRYNEAAGYAVISGGQPTVETPDGCRTGTGVNNAGLWIFTRAQARDEITVRQAREVAKVYGFDLSVLNDVDQTHCNKEAAEPDAQDIQV